MQQSPVPLPPPQQQHPQMASPSLQLGAFVTKSLIVKRRRWVLLLCEVIFPQSPAPFTYHISRFLTFRSSFALSHLESALPFPSAMTVHQICIMIPFQTTPYPPLPSGKFHATPDVSSAGQTLVASTTSAINFPFAQYLTKCVRYQRVNPSCRLTIYPVCWLNHASSPSACRLEPRLTLRAATCPSSSR